MTEPNSEYPQTRASLLVQLKDEDDTESWCEFVRIYRPIIYRMACKRGFQDADAQDLAQQVLYSVYQSIGRWEKRDESIRFRHWLRRVAKNAILNALTRQSKDKGVGGSNIKNALESTPECEEQLVREIELEHRRELFFKAIEVFKKEVSEDVWCLFKLSVIDELPIGEVADKVKKTVAATYAARARAMNRLRQIVGKFQQMES